MNRQNQAYIYAIIVVLIWSTVASVFKITLQYMNFLHMTFFASIVSMLCFFVMLLAQNKFSHFKEFSLQDYLQSMLLGFLNPCLYYFVLFRAYSLLPAQIAQPLNYTWPIMLVLLSIPLLKQKIRFKNILAIITSYLGVFIILTRGDVAKFAFLNVAGILLALGSTIIWSLFWIFNIKDRRDEVVRLFLNFLFGVIFLSIILLIFTQPVFPDIKGFLGATYVGLFEMGITFVLWLKALRMSKTTAQVSNLIYIAPFLSLVLINFVVGEKILFTTIIGLIFIVCGIIIQRYND
jgi:drug/metabolite transporter (DMT)-like permease